ncbi:MAG: heavy metal-binding domain-containing protein, partial [Clostridium sp.]
EGALDEIKRRAAMVGANAIVGIKIDYETLGQSGMLMVTASGTAVYID